MWNNTSVSQLLNIKYPIIQGPFGGRFSSVKLVSSVSNLGGMGSFGLNSYGPEEILEINKEIVAQTEKPYALNLWVPLKDDPADAFTSKDFEEVRGSFRPHFEKVGVPLPDQMNKGHQNFETQVEAILGARPPVVSFIFGIPSSEIIQEFKKQRTVILAVATSVDEAIAIQKAGLDIVIASGSEAGGHRGFFLNQSGNTLGSTSVLVQKIRRNVSIPVIAAGGISTGIDIATMLQKGAGAVQIGTAFLATEESNAPDEHKAKLLAETKIMTGLTRVFTGRMARVITTEFVNEMDKHNTVAPYPIQSSFLSPLRKAAKAKGTLDYEAFWAGQPSTILKHKSAAGLFESLLEEVDREY